MGLNRNTNIVWCDHTYNLWRACAKVSEGCRNCWAENMMMRFDHTPEDWTVANIGTNFEVYDEDPASALDLETPAWIFTPSASDPCLPWLPDDVQAAWADALWRNTNNCYQVLTKWGAEDAGKELPDMPPNVILGVSCETIRRRYRIDWLREQDAHTKFVSFEPLIEPIPDVDLTGIDWVIVGGESGGVHPEEHQRRVEAGEIAPDSDVALRRPMDPAWAVDLYHAAREHDVAFLFKQHSGPHAEGDRELAVGGHPPQEYNEFPSVVDDVPQAPKEFVEGRHE